MTVHPWYNVKAFIFFVSGSLVDGEPALSRNRRKVAGIGLPLGSGCGRRG
jgi:hypothetical protein